MSCQRLLSLSSCVNPPTIKATISGITILKQGSYKSRYTGSKRFAVDINGKLWTNINDLKKELSKGIEVRPKKKATVPAVTPENTTFLNDKINSLYENLPTNEIKFLTSLPELSTLEESPKKKGFRVNGKEVRQRILGMIHTKAGKKELYFWTITFPKGTPDDIAYQAYNTWLTTLRTKDKFGRRFLKNYLWITERQKNGTAHFHIAIPHKMPVKEANKAMQKILANLSKKGLVPFTPAQCKRYNGIDIAKNRSTGRVTNFAIKKGTRALVTYLTKYVTKNNAEFSRLAWHHSRGFSALFTGITFTAMQFNSLYEKRVTAEGAEVLVKWTHFLRPCVTKKNPDGSNMKDKFGDLIYDFTQYESEYFIFIPWQHSMPKELLNHLNGLNDYLQDFINKN